MGSSRGTTPSCRAIAEYWKANRPRVGYAADGEIDEYTCMACGLYHESYKKNKVKMTRHHVHPWQFSESHELNNLVLLCERCHDDCPHVDDPSAFWEWCSTVPSWLKQYGIALREAIDSLGISEDELERMHAAFDPEELGSITRAASASGAMHPTLKSSFVRLLTMARKRMNAIGWPTESPATPRTLRQTIAEIDRLAGMVQATMSMEGRGLDATRYKALRKRVAWRLIRGNPQPVANVA